MNFSTSAWSVQHPNSGQNIQQWVAKMQLYVLCLPVNKEMMMIYSNLVFLSELELTGNIKPIKL